MKTNKKSFWLSLLFVAAISFNLNAQSVGDQAPDFTLEKLGGGNFTLSEYSGKVVFIFFFGNGCPHCISNGPNTETDIYNVYKNHPDFVAVGIDTWQSNATKVQGYKASTGITYPLLIDGSSVESDYATTYDRIVIVNQEGKIEYKSTSNATKSNTAIVSDVIFSLLGVTGINSREIDSKQIALAPNIVTNELLIINPFEQEQQVSLDIIDLAGKVVLKEQVTLSGETTFNIDGLNPGVFTLIIKNESDYRITKFVKR